MTSSSCGVPMRRTSGVRAAPGGSRGGRSTSGTQVSPSGQWPTVPLSRSTPRTAAPPRRTVTWRPETSAVTCWSISDVQQVGEPAGERPSGVLAVERLAETHALVAAIAENLDVDVVAFAATRHREDGDLAGRPLVVGGNPGSDVQALLRPGRLGPDHGANLGEDLGHGLDADPVKVAVRATLPDLGLDVRRHRRRLGRRPRLELVRHLRTSCVGSGAAAPGAPPWSRAATRRWGSRSDPEGLAPRRGGRSAGLVSNGGVRPEPGRGQRGGARWWRLRCERRGAGGSGR